MFFRVFVLEHVYHVTKKIKYIFLTKSTTETTNPSRNIPTVNHDTTDYYEFNELISVKKDEKRPKMSLNLLGISQQI